MKLISFHSLRVSIHTKSRYLVNLDILLHRLSLFSQFLFLHLFNSAYAIFNVACFYITRQLNTHSTSNRVSKRAQHTLANRHVSLNCVNFLLACQFFSHT